MYLSVRIDPTDSVTMVLQHTPAGSELQVLVTDMKAVGKLVTVEDIPFGHKACIVPVTKGELVRKFGSIIGRATDNIALGAYVHIHNLVSIEGSEKIIGRRIDG